MRARTHHEVFRNIQAAGVLRVVINYCVCVRCVCTRMCSKVSRTWFFFYIHFHGDPPCVGRFVGRRQRSHFNWVTCFQWFWFVRWGCRYPLPKFQAPACGVYGFPCYDTHIMSSTFFFSGLWLRLWLATHKFDIFFSVGTLLHPFYLRASLILILTFTRQMTMSPCVL